MEPTGYRKEYGNGFLEWCTHEEGKSLVSKVILDGTYNQSMTIQDATIALQVHHVSIDRRNDVLSYQFLGTLEAIRQGVGFYTYKWHLSWDSLNNISNSGHPLLYLNALSATKLLPKLAYAHAESSLRALHGLVFAGISSVETVEQVIQTASTPWDVLD